MGKIYHNPTPDPQSWSEAVQSPETVRSAYSKETLKEIRKVQKNLPAKDWRKNNLRGPASMPNVNDDIETTWDGAQTTIAVKTLKRLARQEKPFFLAMGYVRPHLPYTPPEKYWKLYDREAIKLAPNRFMPEGGFQEGVGSNYELRHYSDMIDFPRPHEGEVDVKRARRLIHGYYASISFVDDQIGRLLKTLKDEGLQKTPSSFSGATTAGNSANTTAGVK